MSGEVAYPADRSRLSGPSGWKPAVYMFTPCFLHLGWLSTQLGTLPDHLLLGPICSFLSWFCVLTCLLKEGVSAIFANFLEIFEDGVAHSLCVFFLSKIWPG